MQTGATSHVIKRALERHGLKLTADDLRAMAVTCAAGHGLVKRWKKSGRERHRLEVYGKTISVIYEPFFGPTNLASDHKGAGVIITVEPKKRERVMASVTSLAYELRALDPPRDMRTAATLTCANCGTKGRLGIAGMGNNPEKINQQFIRIGWDADVWHHAKNFCPKCVAQRAERVKAEIESTMPTKPVPVARILPAPAAQAPAPTAEPFKLGAGTRTAEVTDVKKLSAQQRGLLRTALESYFNADTGRYETDWSDKRISDELQIPRKIVADYRDLMYGEIQEDPELKALKQMIEEANRVMGNLQASQQRINAKLEAIAKKYGGN